MKVFVVDDSRLARQELKQQLAKHEDIEVVGEAENVEQAVELISSLDIDLLLLDIDLPDGTGFDVLEKLVNVPQVIFVTAYNDFAIKSFEYNALDYLLKPVRQERLDSALDKVTIEIEQSVLDVDQRIFIKDREDCYFVPLSDIYAFEAMGNYTRIYLQNGSPSIYKPISAVAERLNDKVFFRASRSWVINVKFIKEIESAPNGSLEVTLSNNHMVTISKRQAVDFKKAWSL